MGNNHQFSRAKPKQAENLFWCLDKNSESNTSLRHTGSAILILTPLLKGHSLETYQPVTDTTVPKNNQAISPRAYHMQGQSVEAPEKQDQAPRSGGLKSLESQKHVLGSSSHPGHHFWCKWNSKASAVA